MLTRRHAPSGIKGVAFQLIKTCLSQVCPPACFQVMGAEYRPTPEVMAGGHTSLQQVRSWGQTCPHLGLPLAFVCCWELA